MWENEELRMRQWDTAILLLFFLSGIKKNPVEHTKIISFSFHNIWHNTYSHNFTLYQWSTIVGVVIVNGKRQDWDICVKFVILLNQSNLFSFTVSYSTLSTLILSIPEHLAEARLTHRLLWDLSCGVSSATSPLDWPSLSVVPYCVKQYISGAVMLSNCNYAI